MCWIEWFIKLVLRDKGFEYIFSQRVTCVQKDSMRHTRGLIFGSWTTKSVQQFVKRLWHETWFIVFLWGSPPQIIEIIENYGSSVVGRIQWLMPLLTFLKCLMENLFLTSSVLTTWKRSGAPTCSMLRGQSQFIAIIYLRLFLELDLVCKTWM
jgi:hypothetical protein